MKSGKGLVRYAVMLSPDDIARMRVDAKKRGGPVSPQIRRAIKIYLWLVEEYEKGNKIIVRNPSNGKEAEVLFIP